MSDVRVDLLLTKEAFDEALTQHAEQERENMQKLIGELLKNAFPDGDPVGHRLAHEKMVKAAEAQESFWREMKIEIGKKSIWGILQILVMLVLAGIGAKLLGLPFVATLLGSGK